MKKLWIILFISAMIVGAYAQVHFSPVTGGNFTTTHNVYIYSAELNEVPLDDGDEIAIFSYNSTGTTLTCVAAAVLTEPIDQYLRIPAPQNDPPNGEPLTGYFEGSAIVIKVWHSETETEYSSVGGGISVSHYETSLTEFEMMGSSFVHLVIVDSGVQELFNSNREGDIIETSATLVNGYPDENNVYRAVDLIQGTYWEIEFSIDRVDSDIDISSEIRRQYETTGSFPNFVNYRGPEHWWLNYSFDNGTNWEIDDYAEFRSLGANMDWLEWNYSIPLEELEGDIESVLVRWYSFGAELNNGWGEIKNVIVTATVEAIIPLENELVWNSTFEHYQISGFGPNLRFIFDPVDGQPQTRIFVEFSDDPEHPEIQNFNNPLAIGTYVKFTFENPSVLSAGGTFTLQMIHDSIQIWFKTSATWSIIPLEYIDGPHVPNYSYVIDVTDMFGGEGLRNDSIEFVGDNGVETLPVELSSFTASITLDTFVKLDWTSETETNMLGYNIYRNFYNGISEAVKINTSIIPAYNKSTTQHYSFVDNTVMNDINTYYYWLQSVDNDLTNQFHGPISINLDDNDGTGTVITPELSTRLIGAYPNPFNPDTKIMFTLAENTDVTISIYNIMGQHIRTLTDKKYYEKGKHSIYWDGTDSYGGKIGSGVYFCRMKTEIDEDSLKRMLLLK